MEEEEAGADWQKEMRKGYLRIAVLALLSKGPRHGYEIMKEIEERTGGFWRPTPGGIYPILRSLEESRCIKGKWDTRQLRRRKIYRITETGRPVLQKALTRQNQIAGSMGGLFKEFMEDVLHVNSAVRPPIPDFFSVFLEERKEKPMDTVGVLEHKKSQLENIIESVQKELEVINKRLAKRERTKRKAKRRRLN